LGRILAIDYGRKRSGIAVTDSLQMIATGLAAVRTHDIWEFIAGYMQKETVDSVVVGYPVQMNNQPSESVPFVNEFINRFRKLYPGIPLFQVDERFTSKLAMQTMIDGGVPKAKRQDKGLIDTISAVIILQSYLESRAYGGKP
jgi:putative holliday junction resolvase